MTNQEESLGKGIDKYFERHWEAAADANGVDKSGEHPGRDVGIEGHEKAEMRGLYR